MMSLHDFLRRPGALWADRLKPVLDDVGRVLPGALCEKRFVDVNGTRQGMFVRGKDVGNPVLLYLHGGLPEMAHSGGSFIGLQAVSRQPELYAGYIGMAQMVDQLRSERLADG